MNPFLFGNPAAIGQQTAAARLITAYSAGNGTTRGPARRRRKAPRAAARKTAKRRSAKARGRPARLVKGSAAARAYMAKIRRKRRK
jgi:hypothetical protein